MGVLLDQVSKLMNRRFPDGQSIRPKAAVAGSLANRYGMTKLTDR
jgi:hypothetical protein